MATAATVLPTRPAGPTTSAREYSEYALAVQTAADKAVQSIKGKTELQGLTWASPLSAAPSAVGTMAILFKTASAKAAAGLLVTTRDITDGNGKVLKQLKYDLLHSNLQDCSNVGKHAFDEARTVMSSIHHVASRMTQDNGNIEYIIKMLDDREEARGQLKSEMERVGSSAKGCLQEISKLTDRFHYWHAFIECLKNNAIECRGKTQEAKNDKEDEQKKTETEVERYEREEQIAASKVQELKDQLEKAKLAVTKAEEHVNKIQNQPPITVPSDAELRRRANKEIKAASKQTGIIKGIKNAIVGESDSDVAAKQAREHDADLRREEFIKNERARREEDRKLAADRLREAREYEVQLRASSTEAAEKLAESQTQRGEAAANLLRTQGQLQRLADDKLELKDILDILKQSTAQLNKLRRHVDELVHFFETILEDVKMTVDNDIEDFFRPIQNGTRLNWNGQVDCVMLSADSKQRVINQALHIQGGFSTVRDVTAAYVAVSDRYIKPAIKKMDELSDLEGDEWAEESQAFTEWCNTSVKNIEKFAEEASQKAETNMTERIQHLQRKAIEAAPEAQA